MALESGPILTLGHPFTGATLTPHRLASAGFTKITSTFSPKSKYMIAA